MSNFNEESRFENLTEALSFIFEQQMKGIYTCLPGVVVSYNAATKRAKITPAIKRLLTTGEALDLPDVVDVPICFPTGGGFSLLFPVKAGDACLLMFSQRGIENFKLTYAAEKPDEGLFALNDAIAIMGFGPLSLTPASATGASLQSDDGANFVTVESGKVTIETTGEVIVNCASAEINANTLINGNLQVDGLIGSNGYQTLTGSGAAQINGGLDIIGGTVNHDSVNIGKNHTHSGVVVGGGNTGGPQ